MCQRFALYAQIGYILIIEGQNLVDWRNIASCFSQLSVYFRWNFSKTAPSCFWRSCSLCKIFDTKHPLLHIVRTKLNSMQALASSPILIRWNKSQVAWNDSWNHSWNHVLVCCREYQSKCYKQQKSIVGHQDYFSSGAAVEGAAKFPCIDFQFGGLNYGKWPNDGLSNYGNLSARPHLKKNESRIEAIIEAFARFPETPNIIQLFDNYLK